MFLFVFFASCNTKREKRGGQARAQAQDVGRKLLHLHGHGLDHDDGASSDLEGATQPRAPGLVELVNEGLSISQVGNDPPVARPAAHVVGVDNGSLAAEIAAGGEASAVSAGRAAESCPTSPLGVVVVEVVDSDVVIELGAQAGQVPTHGVGHGGVVGLHTVLLDLGIGALEDALAVAEQARGGHHDSQAGQVGLVVQGDGRAEDDLTRVGQQRVDQGTVGLVKVGHLGG